MTMIDRASMACLLTRAHDVLVRGGNLQEPGLLDRLLQALEHIVAHQIPWSATLHLAHIDHRHGANVYAAASRPSLIEQLAAFCREWWSEINDPRDPTSSKTERSLRTISQRRMTNI